MFVIKLLLSDFSKASRDKREVAVLEGLGYSVCIMYPFDKDDAAVKSKYKVAALPQSRLSMEQSAIYRKFIIIRDFLSTVKRVRSMKADCISCHNLAALFIGWLCTWGKRRKPKLVYDAHEFEVGINERGERGKFVRWMVPRLEKFLMKKCAFSIMVNDSIANAVQKMYGLNERPLVVRNIPQRWERDDEACRRIRSEIYGALNISEDRFIVMYHGGVINGRGIETLLEAVKADTDIAAVILGDGEQSFLNMLKKRAAELGIADRVLFHPAVPVSILKDYVGAADLGVTLAKNTCMNHYYMLPNKLFECIQAETPIIGSEFPEIKRIIDGYGVGLCCNPENVESIVECIEKLRTDKELYLRIKDNLKAAKEELCWENERKRLERAYKACNLNIKKSGDMNGR